MRYEEIKEKIQKIQGSVSDFGVLVGPHGSEKQVEGISVMPGLGMDSDAKSFEMMAEDIRKGIFKVLFMGEFKQGKSTAINAVIGKNAVPTKVVACTAIITILVYGTNTNRASVYRKGNPVPEVLTLEDFFKKYQLTLEDQDMIEELGYIDRFEDIEYAVIESNHQIFENGVRIIDSPGLGEANSRTKTTLNFVSSANAVVFLLNAIKLFSKDEKEYIKANFANKQLKNVFFVVNRVNQINGPIEEIIPTVEANLKTVFTDKDGNFDRDLYDKRVFYVNAYGAYTAKQEGNIDSLPSTGMPKFESALEEFLTSEDRIIATFQSTITQMANSYKNALTVVENQKNALRYPLIELEENHKKSMEKLDELESKVKEIEKTFSTTSTLVQSKVYGDLLNYISIEMPAMWDRDVANNDTKFGIGQVMKLAWDGITTWDKEKRAEKQERTIKPLAESIQKYIVQKLDDWGKRTDILISPEIEAMKEELEEQIGDFNLGLTNASKMFAENINASTTDGEGANAFQLGLSLLQGDASVLIENAAGGNFTWGEWIKKYAVQAVMQIVLFSVFTGGLGFVAWLVMESIQLVIGSSKLKEKFLRGMSEKLFSGLTTAVREKETSIKGGINEKFMAECNAVATKSRELITEEKNRQQKILDDKNNKQFDIETEISRMNTIISKMFSLMNTVYSEMFGKELAEADVDTIARIVVKSKNE